MAYRYLLVDNDNTLMDFTLAEKLALRDTLASLTLPADEETAQLYHRINKSLWEALERREITMAALKLERFARLLQALGRDDIAPGAVCEMFHRQLGSHAELLDGAAELMRNVKPHMKIALVSNGISDIQRSRLSRCPLTPLMDAVIISEERGVSKPDPAMAEIALAELGCTDKSAAVFLGDSLTADVACARRAGIDSIWLSPVGASSPEPSFTVRSLREAAELLTQRGGRPLS